jgi:hypothetical protein
MGALLELPNNAWELENRPGSESPAVATTKDAEAPDSGDAGQRAWGEISESGDREAPDAGQPRVDGPKWRFTHGRSRS